jgi:DNA-binding CsgD family transcriptional regulator
VTRDVLSLMTGEPVKILITGGIGSGKSDALEAVRRALREAGQTVLGRLPRPGEIAAVVIDDAHLLGDAELRALTELASEPGRTVVVAMQSRDRNPVLSSLQSTLEREQPRISLGPFSSDEVSRLLADASGRPPSPDVLGAAMAATGGIPLLVSALAAARPPISAPEMDRAAVFALIDRLRRLDQPELEALLIVSLSTDLGAADLAAVIGGSVEHNAALIDRARGTGLVQPAYPPEFLRIVHQAVGHLIGPARHHELETALLRTQLASSALSLRLALELAEHGYRDDALTLWLGGQAAACQSDMPAKTRIYRAAVQCGATDMRAGLADALALNGDTADAAVLADELLGSADPAQRAAGVRVAASVAADNGNYAHAAELFGWLGPYPDATVGSAAALVHTATGDLTAARAALEAARTGPPTAAARSARSLAEGLVMTVDGDYPAAATRLGQALAGDHTAIVALPDSPAAVVALPALHNGDAVRARSVIERAVREAQNDPLFGARHRLLRGWVRMQEGQLTLAAADADAATNLRGGRDVLWAAALRTAIARRGGDIGALQHHWAVGMEALAEYSIDLFSLLPLGELWMAAARMRQHERLTPALEQGFGVLAALGDPPAWAPLMHWAGVHAGILAGDPAAVAPHGQALTALAARSAFAAALAAAGRAWLRVLANQVDSDEVLAAARGLAGLGLTSDATRLAGQAALQTQDPRVSGVMLQAARDLKLGPGPDGPAAQDIPQSAGHQTRPASTALSDREREVAELLLRGRPYRDIGAQLFISAKTVEHHVARIRRRLGAESRSEMLSMLRALLGGDESQAPPNRRA